jgi:hypothetical protein
LAQTEDGVTPDFGVPNAIHVHKTRAYATPPAVAAKAPTAGEREPVQHHHLYNTLSKRQSRDARRFIASFELYLTAEEVVTFRSGHRLSPDQVHDLVTELGTDQAREKGVRMSYEPTPDFTDEDLDRLRHATRSDDEPTVDVKFFLAQLWFYADPLWLELCADAHSHGINMAFNASAGAARRSARNMPMTAHKRRKLMEILDDDIQKGRAEGWYKEPPFKAYEIIPLGLVPKNIDEDIWRAIKNWSAGQGLSVNANSDTMHIPFGLFERAVEALHRAGKNVHFLKWDISGAYATIRIRPADRRLTVFHVPGKGYSHRNSCDFGGRVFGYRWEVCGGRLYMLHPIPRRGAAHHGRLQHGNETYPSAVHPAIRRPKRGSATRPPAQEAQGRLGGPVARDHVPPLRGTTASRSRPTKRSRGGAAEDPRDP